MLHQDGFSRPILEGPYMRAFVTRHVGWCGCEGYILSYEFFIAFGHISINTKANVYFVKNASSELDRLLDETTKVFLECLNYRLDLLFTI